MSTVFTLGVSGPRADLHVLAKEGLRRLARWALIGLGGLIMLVGVLLTLLPGHLGLPILVVGLMVVLRNSISARREFIKYQRRHPNLVFPIRRLMRREPEIVPVFWQQILRVEKLILPRRWRSAGKLRRRFLRRRVVMA